MDNADTKALVISCLHEILSDIYKKEQVEMPHLRESTRLIGRQSVLDSLGLVNLIVDIEQKLSDDHDIGLTIADERALSQQKSPFRTVGALSAYISSLIEEKRQNVAS